MKIRTKINGMGVLLVLMTAATMVGIVGVQKSRLSNALVAEVDQQMRMETQKAAQNVYLMCRMMQESLDLMLTKSMRVAVTALDAAGGIRFGPRQVSWQAVNQLTGEGRPVVLPELLIGNTWPGQDVSMARPMPLVDRVRELQGVTCTVFQRINEAGDMLRVATNVPDAHGRRALGSFIPARQRDGSANPLIQSLLAGREHSGRLFVVNDWYMARYRPLWDRTGTRVVGALYVGQKQDSIAALRQGITDTVVGKTGYVFVMGGHGEGRGRLIVPQPGRQVGDSLLQSHHWETRQVAERLLHKGAQLESSAAGDGIPVHFERYRWRNQGEEEARRKVAALSYFEPWDWVIAATAYEDDFAGTWQRLADSLDSMIFRVGLAALAITLVSLLAGRFVAGGIVRPLEQTIRMFERIGQGRLDQHLDLEARDEIGQLARSFNRMVGNLKSVTASRNELNREIIERTRIEAELRAISDRRQDLETIVNSSPAVAFLGRVVEEWPLEYVSENIRQFGYSPNEFTSGRLALLNLIHPADQSRVQSQLQEHVDQNSGDHLSLEFRLVQRSANVSWGEGRIWLRRDNAGAVTHLQGVLLDISDRKQAEERVQQLAFFDVLTGLPNRALFLNRLEQALAQAQRDERQLALMFIDLDHFKDINDTFGHAVGDLVLQACGRRLSACIRRSDTVARLGGDEMIVLLPGIDDAAQVRPVGEKILKVMSAPFHLQGQQLSVTPSIGIVLFPRDGQDVDTLLQRADMAMYAAKQGGRNRLEYYHPELLRNSQIMVVRANPLVRTDISEMLTGS